MAQKEIMNCRTEINSKCPVSFFFFLNYFNLVAYENFEPIFNALYLKNLKTFTRKKNCTYVHMYLTSIHRHQILIIFLTCISRTPVYNDALPLDKHISFYKPKPKPKFLGVAKL
jgi:hypothetical protein